MPQINTRAPLIKHLADDRQLRRYGDIRDLLPGPDNPTPLVRVNRVTPPDLQLFLKLEWLNPFGSVKDRTAAHLLAGLVERGELADAQLVEASSGNTGIALAALAAHMGVQLTVTIPDGVPEEKKTLLRMLGAEVWETPDDLCPVDHPKDGAIALARSLVASDTGTRYVMADQYENFDNVRAHYETTGPEIWRQTNGHVQYFLAGLGTGGHHYRSRPFSQRAGSDDPGDRDRTSGGTSDPRPQVVQGGQAARNPRLDIDGRRHPG